jgi:hypothetical protein
VKDVGAREHTQCVFRSRGLAPIWDLQNLEAHSALVFLVFASFGVHSNLIIDRSFYWISALDVVDVKVYRNRHRLGS